MANCCALISQRGVKIIAIISVILCGLFVVACILRLGSQNPEPKNDLLGISVGGSLLLASVILYSGAVESSAGRCEIWLAAVLIFCGLQIPSMSDTIQYWETQRLQLLLVDVVQLVFAICLVTVVYFFTKKLRQSQYTRCIYGVA